jgi:adenylate cyclase
VSLSRVLPPAVARRGGARPWKLLSPSGVVVGTAATEAAARRAAGTRTVPASLFRDKVVVIGATAPSLQDIHATSTGAQMAGPEIQANAIETALRGFPLHSVPTWLNVLLVVLLALAAPLVSLRFSPLIAISVSLLACTAFVFGTQLAFQSGWVNNFVYPLAALTAATVGSLGVHYLLAAFERERVRDVFSRFVPEQVVDQVLARTDSDLRLGGREVEATVMFSDLRGFTSSAEHMPAERVIHVLNHYLHEMSEAILGHGGALLSYMGDGIYAVFGAPIEQPDHAERALAAAREMLSDRLPRFNAWMKEQGLGEGYQMGIGLNTGPIMTGNVGHARRLEYTAVGDVVNTASRIEGMTKGTPYSVFVSESTYGNLSRPPDDLVFFEEMEVRGRQAKLRIWALDMRKGEASAGEPALEPTPASAAS